MAQNVDAGAGLLVSVGGWVVALLVAIFTFIAQWRKGGVEETAVVLGKWKELVEAHENQISGLRAEINILRERVRELEVLADERERRIHVLELELAGAKKNLAQQSRSFADQLKRLGHNNPPDFGEKLDGPQDK